MGRPSILPPPWSLSLGELEPVAVAPLLGDDEHGQAPVPQAAVGVGAGQQHEHVGPGPEGAPGLDAVDQPAVVDGGGGDLHPGHVGAVVGLGDGHGVHHLGGGEAGQPLLLLLLGAAGLEGPGEDLRAGDERPAGAEAAPAELLGGHDHGDVVRLGARGEPAVLLADRQAEGTHLGQAGDDVLGDVAFSRWMCSAMGTSFSSAKRRKVSCTISKSSSRPRLPSTSASDARKAGSR